LEKQKTTKTFTNYVKHDKILSVKNVCWGEKWQIVKK